MNGGGEAKQLNAGTRESLAHVHARAHHVRAGTGNIKGRIKGIKP